MLHYERAQLAAYFDDGLGVDTGSIEAVSAFVTEGMRLIGDGISETHVWGIISHFVPHEVLV